MFKHFVAGLLTIAATAGAMLSPSITHAEANWADTGVIDRIEVVQGDTNPWVWVRLKGVSRYSCTELEDVRPAPAVPTYGYFLNVGNSLGYDSMMSTLLAAQLSGRQVQLQVSKHTDNKTCRIERVRIL